MENHSRSDLLTLLKAIYGISGGLADAKKLINNSFPFTAKIANNETVLHAAISVGDTMIVEGLVENMSVEDLQVTDTIGNTAMSYAALYGYTQIAKCLYKKNKNLVTIVNKAERCPVVMACNAGNIDTTRYLYSVTPTDFLLSDNGAQGPELLCNCIDNNMFGKSEYICFYYSVNYRSHKSQCIMDPHFSLIDLTIIIRKWTHTYTNLVFFFKGFVKMS